MPNGEIREPTAAEKAKIAAGRRYDPLRPRAPWDVRERREEARRQREVEREAQREARLYPWGRLGEPLVPWQPFPSQWAVTGAEAQREARLYPWAPVPPTPIIPEPGFERRAGYFDVPVEPRKPWGLEPRGPYPETLRGTISWEKAKREAYRYEQTAAGQFEAMMRREAPVAELPSGIEGWSDEEKAAWANTNALASRFVDEEGSIIPYEEAERLMAEEPGRVITQVWYFGGGSTIEAKFDAGNLYSIGYGPSGGEYVQYPLSEAEAMALGFPEGAYRLSWEERGERERYGKQLYDAPELLAMKRGILGSNMSYNEKLSALLELLPSASRTDEYRRIKAEVFASLSPEEKAEVTARAEAKWKEPAPPKPEVEKPLDIGALEEALEPYGVNITENYPFISPITEAHLRRIPVELLERMADYLVGKGISWQDYLALGEVYAGRAPARARWEPAYQF